MKFDDKVSLVATILALAITGAMWAFDNEHDLGLYGFCLVVVIACVGWSIHLGRRM